MAKKQRERGDEKVTLIIEGKKGEGRCGNRGCDRERREGRREGKGQGEWEGEGCAFLGKECTPSLVEEEDKGAG